MTEDHKRAIEQEQNLRVENERLRQAYDYILSSSRSSQLNGKTVMHKKQVNAYQQHSLLYKIRRDNAHNKKRKQQAKTR